MKESLVVSFAGVFDQDTVTLLGASSHVLLRPFLASLTPFYVIRYCHLGRLLCHRASEVSPFDGSVIT